MSTQTQQPALFPESSDERIRRIDGEILALLTGQAGGRYTETLKEDDRAVLTAVRFRRGRDRAITIREIMLATQLSERQIKGAVRRLRLSFRIPIGSSKHSAAGGYFIWLTRDELDDYKADVVAQLRGELQVLRAITSEADALDICDALRAGVTA